MKKTALRRVIEIAVVLAIVVTIFIINDQIVQNRKKSFKPIEDCNAYAYWIDDAFCREDYFVINGWFLDVEQSVGASADSDDGKMGVLLYDTDSDNVVDLDGNDNPFTGIYLEVESKERNDVIAYFNCNTKYSKCGFEAKIKKSAINFDNKEYRLIFKKDIDGDYGIMSSAYIYNGTIRYVSSEENVELNVSNTELEDIVSNGIYMTGSKENYIAVYQKDNTLYWIVDKERFSGEDRHYIQFEIYIPEYRDTEKKFLELGFFFEDYEITTDIECGNYRVSCRDIPDKYSIVRAVTGDYDYSNDLWVWKKYFRPRYKIS